MRSTDLIARLRAAGCVFAEDEARLIAETARDAADLERLIRGRESGLPLETLLGWADFAGLRIVVRPGVFVPRRRTELLARQAAALAGPGSTVVDLCCGSGAVAAYLLEHTQASVYAADIAPDAVACARCNVPPDRVFQGDLFAALPAALRHRIDVVAVNAPYVPTGEIALMPPEARLHEPYSALDGGPDGVDLHRRIAGSAAQWLRHGGALLIETGRRQAVLTAEALAANGFCPRTVSDDELGATVVLSR